jgi:hypothetical protein
MKEGGGCEVKRQWGGQGVDGSFVSTYKRAG